MKKIIIVFISFFIVLGIYQYFFSLETDSPEPQVYVLKDSIVYDGSLTAEGVKKAKNLYSKNINNLILNSRGGEVNLGMDLGEWVFDKKLNVIVKYIAASSAANYIFTAGQKKFLYKNSFIAWHGGAFQAQQTLYEKFFTKFILKDYMTKTRKRELEFFKKINVDYRITILGQQENFKKYDDSYSAWTYSLNALSKLGVDNIILIDGEWTPITEFKGKKLFIIENIDGKEKNSSSRENI